MMTQDVRAGLSSTMSAIHTFVEKRSNPDSESVILMLDQEDGKTILRAVSRSDLSTFEKIKAFFGCSNCNLSKIISYISSDFCKNLDSLNLTKMQLVEINQAVALLDLGVEKHNQRVWFTRIPIYVNLAETILNRVSVKLVARMEESRSLAKLLTEGKFHDALSRLESEKQTFPQEFEEEALRFADVAIAQCEQKLVQEFKAGRVSISQFGAFDSSKIASDFVPFMDKLKQMVSAPKNIQEKIDAMSKRAALRKEIDLLEKMLAPKPDFVTATLLQSFCKKRGKKYPETKMIFMAQQKELAELLAHGETSVDPQIAKQKALFHLVGIPSKEIATWQKRINEAATQMQKLQLLAKDKTALLIQKIEGLKLPQIACDSLKRTVRKLSHDIAEMAFSDSIDTSPQKAKLDTLFKWLEETLEIQAAFYQKWQKQLKAEMQQGFYDPGEMLGDGVCRALSLRWAIAELKKSSEDDVQDLINELKIGQTFAEDRNIQAKYQIGFVRGGNESAELQEIQRRLGVKSYVDTELGTNIEGADKIELALKKYCEMDLFRIMHKGVGQLSFSWEGKGHAITICFQRDLEDPANSIYRISDPNYGTFNFSSRPPDYDRGPVERQFFECLAELLTTMYSSKIERLTCRCFELTA